MANEPLRILKRGSKGELVEEWQAFLLGLGHYDGEIDGDFGPKSQRATMAYEKACGMRQDGIVDNMLWMYAMQDGLSLLGVVRPGYDTPSRPVFRPLTTDEKHEKYGRIICKPHPKRKGGVQIVNGWIKNNLTAVHVPQLEGVKGAPRSCKILWNKAGVDQLRGLFDSIQNYGMLPLLVSYHGAWAPRFSRGSSVYLSSHSWATAIDLNYSGNELNRIPSPLGEHGSMREVAELAKDFGFFWGGFFPRPDGMHLELV